MQRSFSIKHLLPLLVVVLLLTPAAEHAVAADKATAADDSTVLAEQVQDLLTVIDERRAQAAKIKAQHKGSTGEERALTIIEILQVEDALREALDQSLAKLEKQQEAGVRPARGRQEAARQC